MSRRNGEWALEEAPRLARSSPPAKKLRVQAAELHRLRAELEATRRRYSTVYESMPIACVTLDRDGRVFEANPAACSLVGIARDALQHKPLCALMLPEEAEGFQRLLAGVLLGGERTSCEVSLRGSGGASSKVRIVATRVSRGGLRGGNACLCSLLPARRSRRATPAVADISAALDALIACTEATGDDGSPADDLDARLATAHELAVRARALLRPKADASVETSAKTILVVDDDAALRRALRRQLAGAGFVVAEAESGEAALALFDRVRPDVVVSDVHMPGIGGEVLVERLRARRADLPVLVMSGALQSLGRGPLPAHTRFLAKPFTNDALLAEVRALLDSK